MISTNSRICISLLLSLDLNGAAAAIHQPFRLQIADMWNWLQLLPPHHFSCSLPPKCQFSIGLGLLHGYLHFLPERVLGSNLLKLGSGLGLPSSDSFFFPSDYLFAGFLGLSFSTFHPLLILLVSLSKKKVHALVGNVILPAMVAPPLSVHLSGLPPSRCFAWLGERRHSYLLFVGLLRLI